jgi:O-antigen/teichoic acid export membrane protein
MISRLRQLGKDSLVYGVGGIVSRGAGFLLIPIYTRVFSPEEYGTIEMLNVLSLFLGALLAMGMDTAQGFFFFEQKKHGQEAQAKIISAILQWRLIWGTAIVIAAIIIWSPLNYLFFNQQLTWIYFGLSFTGIFFFQIMTQSVEVFRLLDRPWSYIGLELGQTLLTAALILVLVLGFDLGILGFLWGVLIGAFVSTIMGWWSIRNYVYWSGDCRNWWRRLLKFSAPLVPNMIFIYLLNTCDRWFVSHYNGQAALGLYAIGAKFALLVYFAANMFRLAWWPVAMDAMHSEEGPELFRTIARLYLGAGAIFVVLITVMSPYILNWFTTVVYLPAYPIIGILSWYAVFYGFYLIGAAGILKSEKTFISPFLIGTAVLCDIILNLLLVPRYGGVGAAIATSTSFGIWIILAVIISEKLWPVHHRFFLLSCQVITGIIGSYFILYCYHYQTPNLVVLLVAIVTIAILLTLTVSRRELQIIINVLQKTGLSDKR